MNYQIFIFSRKELKIIIIATIFGGIVQIACWQYLKNHPELLNNDNSKKLKPKKPGLRPFFPRGGAIVEVAGAKVIINITATLVYLAKQGTLTSAGLAVGILAMKKIKIPKGAVSKYVRNALPTTYAGFEKGHILVDGKKVVLDQCDTPLEYMFQLLSNKDIPFEYKKEKTLEILMNNVDLKTPAGRIRFVLCIISMIHVFVLNDSSSYFILMQNLLDALKSGKITKRLARLIIRRLLRKGLPVEPELVKAAS